MNIQCGERGIFCGEWAFINKQKRLLFHHQLINRSNKKMCKYEKARFKRENGVSPFAFYSLATLFFGVVSSPFIYFFYLTFKAMI